LDPGGETFSEAMLVSMTEVAREVGSMLVRDVMTVDPMTTTPGSGVKSALKRLSHLRVTSLPVVDDRQQLCGIVSEADLIRGMAIADPRARERPITMHPVIAARTVEDVYTRAPTTVRPEDDVITAVDLMGAKGFKSLPVVDDDHRLVGMVSRSDVVLALARDDGLIAEDISRVFGELGRTDWRVEVAEGFVEIAGPAAADHSLAHTIARTVPGVVGVRIR
jgi:CBS domain-containing protein